jgi:hypothetical protein
VYVVGKPSTAVDVFDPITEVCQALPLTLPFNHAASIVSVSGTDSFLIASGKYLWAFELGALEVRELSDLPMSWDWWSSFSPVVTGTDAARAYFLRDGNFLFALDLSTYAWVKY